MREFVFWEKLFQKGNQVEKKRQVWSQCGEECILEVIQIFGTLEEYLLGNVVDALYLLLGRMIKNNDQSS